MGHIEQNSDLKKVLHDFYGTNDLTFTGSGRPFFLLPKKKESEMETYINKVHEMNLKFTWLWNGECLGYYKFNSEQQKQALKELDWLDDLGVEYLTVTDPYLAEFAKNYHPRIKLKASVIAEVNSLSRALEWQDIIGPEGVLTLSVMLNRNFPLLKEIRESIKCDIEILVSDCCLNECPFRFFHYTECSHASQTHDVLEGYYNDWSTIACQNQKAFNSEQVLMCKWIQPADLDKFLEIGIDYFKISGRRYDTDRVFKSFKAYAQKRYDGDLGGILDGYSFVSDPLELAGAQFSEFAAKQEKMGGKADDLGGIMLSVPDFKAILDASKLKDFLKNFPFQGARCAENCGISCSYCYKYVSKAYFLPSKEDAEYYREYMQYLYNFLNHAEILLPKEQRKLKIPGKKVELNTYIGVPWGIEAQKFLEEALMIIPKEMQQIAKQGIGYTAERTAEKKGLNCVDKDLLIAIIIQMVPQPYKHDFLDFLEEKRIDPTRFLKSDDINYIKSLPYGTELMAQKTKERGLSIKEPKLIETQLQIQKENIKKLEINTKNEWEAYLTKFMKAYNEFPDLKMLIKPLAPLLFQYIVSDNSEMNYWQLLDEDKVCWGMGQYSGKDVPKVINKTNFETVKKINSGESDPIQATMAGIYTVEGDIAKLMACAPLIPFNAKAHQKAIES